MRDDTAGEPRRRRRWGRPASLVGIASLFSGVALLTTIVGGVSLPLALAAAGVLAGSTVAIVLRRADARQRDVLRRVALAGAIAGVIATACYDVAKFSLSLADPSPYNPFEATGVFGTLLLGDRADPLIRQGVGVSFHFLNGTAFGVAYCLFFGRYGRSSIRWAAVSGIGWGVFLEAFQLTLYPGWLDIRAYREFATISALAHLVYGATLGFTGRALLRRLVPTLRAQAAAGGVDKC